MRTNATLLAVGLAAGVAFAQESKPPATAPDKNQDVIATVLGKQITAAQKDDLAGLICRPLLEKFAGDNKIDPTQAELNAFVKRMEQSERQLPVELERNRKRLLEELKSDSLSDPERKEKQAELKVVEELLESQPKADALVNPPTTAAERLGRLEVARHFVQMWKINKALYDKYGGRVIFQQAGPEPLDAYREFLEDQQRQGAFKILDKRYEPQFWRYYTNDKMHTFAPKEAGAKLISTPWWLMEKPLAPTD